MRLRYALPAGLVDAGLSSLATLGVGIYAARSLTTAEFGTYALFFSAFTVATVLPTQLILVPAEVTTLLGERAERLGVLRWGWRGGLPIAVVASTAASAAAWLGARASRDVLWAFAVTMAAFAVASTLQDHVRRCLHMAGAHWRAAVVSLVQLLAIVSSLVVLGLAGVRNVWRPFTALTVANLVSLSVGYALSRHDLRRLTTPRYRLMRLARSGQWLLMVELATSGALFFSSTIITRLASAEALGYAESARIVAQPLYVLTIGLSASLWPRSMEAAAGRSREAARRIARLTTAVMLVVGLLYGAVTIVPWWGNPLATLIPQAYAVEGLVGLSVLGFVVVGVSFPPRTELIGAGMERSLAGVAVLASVLQCAAAFSAMWVGPFARPIGLTLFALVLVLGCWRQRKALYEEAVLIPEAGSRPMS
jgi:O-antigen/teichoic acid export membrane protein